MITKLHNSLYPSSKVPFPAVSICNVNRISRRAAVRFAEELRSKDKKPEKDKTTEYYLKRIQLLASLYSYEYDDEVSLNDFQRTIDEIYDTQTFTIMNDIMLKLTPRCEEMMLRCIWQSKEYKCVDGPLKMFERRRSEYGHCCSFNYVIRPNNVVEKPRLSAYTGPDMGLLLLVHGQPNDYFYQMSSMKGFHVIIHNPYDFPDMPSGGINQVQVQLGRETFIRVDSHTITPDPFIRNFNPATRSCYFPLEMGTKFGGTYVKSQCIVYCRMKSILALCDCVPFSMPVDIFFKNNATTMQICNLNHISCLNRYRIKWLTISTEILQVKGLEREREESLLCQDCLPSCYDQRYFVSTNSLPLRLTKRKGTNIMESVKNVSQTALIRIYFGSPDAWQFLTTVQLTWYEIVSSFGGIFGVLLGFSMLSATEIIYFIVREFYFWFRNKWHHYKLETDNGIVIVP